MSRDLKLKCVAVRSPRGTRETIIEWGDGHIGRYPHTFLRGYCPCAGCQGHGGGIKFIEAEDRDLELDEIAPVGNYALRLKWFGGHEGGIYTFAYLRSLCRCDVCRPGDAKEDRSELPRT